VLNGVPVKTAIQDADFSFYKLTIKVRPKIVADGLNNFDYDVSNVGNHLSAKEFHDTIGGRDVIVVDMRNHYESEIGHFRGAVLPDADTFREALHMVSHQLAGKQDHKLLLYCTGGIRCEKASAYLRSKGFKDVNQLHGGIIEYAKEIKKLNVPSKFVGKNFVFDNRLGESIDGTTIGKCHQCGNLCDTHTNCANDDCHLLFIQCDACQAEYDGCCSTDCKEISKLPEAEQKAMRRLRYNKCTVSKIFKSRLRPRLSHR
jgi:UPF0176 protein